jgi:nucleoside-diphosphate-sugar epimerase
MNILVTGSSGFIGHHIINQLYGDHYIVGVDNHDTYGSLDKNELGRLVRDRNEYAPANDEYKFDIRHGEPFFGDKYDIVIHTASFPRQHEVARSPVQAIDTMTAGLLHTLNAADGCDRFVFLSSSMVYGDFPNFVDEDHVTNPNTLYGQLKLTGEQIVKTWCGRHGVPYTIIRPSAVYGERDVNTRLVGKFITQAMRDEQLVVRGYDEILDFTHVTDLAKGIVQAAFSSNAEDKTYNLTRSDAKCRTILEAGELAIAIAGKGTLSIQDRDTAFPKRGNLSIEQASNDFGYNPTINIEEGFQRYYEWLHSFLKR